LHHRLTSLIQPLSSIQDYENLQRPANDTDRFSEACVSEARTSSDILALLDKNGNLARYGFFDALAIFSSTLILMMSLTMNFKTDNGDSDRVNRSLILLETMRNEGNMPAVDFFEQLSQVKDELYPKRDRIPTITDPFISGESDGHHINPGGFFYDASWQSYLAPSPYGTFKEQSEYEMTYLQHGLLEMETISKLP
jgi:hypothetical protein